MLWLLYVVGVQGQTAGRPRYYLTVGNVSGYCVSRDLGTSPRVGQGLSVGQGVSLDVETVDWFFSGYFLASGDLKTTGVKYLLRNGSYSGYGGGFDVGVSALRRVWSSGEATWSVAVGGGLTNYTWVGYTPKLMNASFALTDLFQPDLTVLVEYSLPSSNPLVVMRGWLGAFAEVSVSPVGLAYRPGYSYIDNYTGGRGVKDYIFKTYRTGLAWLPYVALRTGVRFNLRGGNRIGLSYRWCYRSSHGTGVWQFDEVRHQVVAELNILLKR